MRSCGKEVPCNFSFHFPVLLVFLFYCNTLQNFPLDFWCFSGPPSQSISMCRQCTIFWDMVELTFENVLELKLWFATSLSNSYRVRWSGNCAQVFFGTTCRDKEWPWNEIFWRIGGYYQPHSLWYGKVNHLHLVSLGFFFIHYTESRIRVESDPTSCHGGSTSLLEWCCHLTIAVLRAPFN